jgi:hypothetical protein
MVQLQLLQVVLLVQRGKLVVLAVLVQQEY